MSLFALTVAGGRAILRPMRALSVITLLAALFLPSGHASASPPIGISEASLQTLQTKAARGDADAQYALGELYANRLGVSQDYTKAREWYEQAAAQGSAMAQVNLGGLYHKGQGVPQDYGKARQWFDLEIGINRYDAVYRAGSSERNRSISLGACDASE